MPERGKLTNNILIKYRPAVLDDLLGNQRAKTAVRNMVRNGLPPGVMFIGPPGVGKSTMAEMLVRMVACENRAENGDACRICSSCRTDLRRGVPLGDVAIFWRNCAGVSLDDMRRMLDKALERYGTILFYFEEAHNAAGRLEDLLLTALEDPVENASFILCTPQPRVFGEALLTRLSRIHLRPPPRTELLALMHRIAANENWPVLSDELLTYCCDIHQDLPRAAVGQVWHCVLSGITTPQELAADLG